MVLVAFAWQHIQTTVLQILQAVVLEMIGDLPEADVKPPSNVLFICKLNPVTTEVGEVYNEGTSMYIHADM